MNAFVGIDNPSVSSFIYTDHCGFAGPEALSPNDAPVILRTGKFAARALQPALGPYGRHLPRFEPAGIVLQGLSLLKVTEVTTRRWYAPHLGLCHLKNHAIEDCFEA